ncbi:Mavicyanin [Sesamum alatum]|uniref:Mavicyanin n=1 Tax=Sesamum alatum TaxID=300844 RepID=A0AAE1Y962_9LAMI|nr:Mavicyanin [Sesamum alatum]
MAVLGGSMGAVYNVGDNVGWTNTGVDYQRWSDAHVFEVGDKIVFDYDPEKHDVLEVSEEDYNSCNASNPISRYTSGHDELEIVTPGTFYYICSFFNMCRDDKQKVVIKIEKDESPSPPFSSPPDRVCKRTSAASSSLSFSKHFAGLLVSCVLLALYLH